MPLTIIRDDLAKVTADAIVNAANHGGGGADSSITRRTCPALLAEGRTPGGCKTGGAKITGGRNLNARCVIHTVCPVRQAGEYLKQMVSGIAPQ